MWQAIAMTLLLLLGSTGTAQAQTKKELVAKLMQLQQGGIENVGRAVAGQPAQRLLQAASQVIPRLPADKRDSVAKDVQADVKKFYDDLEPLVRKRAVELALATLGPMYEERFNEAELKQIVAWLESPVAKKFQQVDSDGANALAQKVAADMRGTIEPRLKTLQDSLAKRLGVQAPSGSAPAASAAKP